ncbi:unnamed protein product [Acanthosepion pharaonis]|uniref:Uncharacterized protein n=1 Tax=Acanthosepion pharaonis TaxID=158019 RepID=A0A812E7E7_ACAPH|nr:unnamed protein product [Sepia pharaonis]
MPRPRQPDMPWKSYLLPENALLQFKQSSTKKVSSYRKLKYAAILKWSSLLLDLKILHLRIDDTTALAERKARKKMKIHHGECVIIPCFFLLLLLLLLLFLLLLPDIIPYFPVSIYLSIYFNSTPAQLRSNITIPSPFFFDLLIQPAALSLRLRER